MHVVLCFQVIDFDDGSGSVLRIQPLRTPRDEAVYECHASNSAGELTFSTRLNVLRGQCVTTSDNVVMFVLHFILCVNTQQDPRPIQVGTAFYHTRSPRNLVLSIVL